MIIKVLKNGREEGKKGEKEKRRKGKHKTPRSK